MGEYKMKYGYMFYQKPLDAGMKTRPINLGDPIQSYAVKNLYKEMGIPKEDIIPVPRFDLTNYNGCECICVTNTASNYEELCYDSYFMPPSKKIHAIPMSLHIHRKLMEGELEFYKSCGEVGCRDISTAQYLRSLGIDSYLTGCLTLTLPKRDQEQHKNADKIYIIDIPQKLLEYIPHDIKEKAIFLSNVLQYSNPGTSNRMSEKDTFEYHQKAEDCIHLLCSTAKLVITGRLHIAAPCLAMGIPVILAKSYFGERFGFLDRLLPAYTPEHFAEINWNPLPVDFEEDKAKIKQLFFNKVRAVASRLEVENMWQTKSPIYQISYENRYNTIVQEIPFPKKDFKYVVWGVILESSVIYLDEAMKKYVPQGHLLYGIDSYSKRSYCGKDTIKPEKIQDLPPDVITIVAAPSAQEIAKEMLLKLNRPFILLKDSVTEWYNMDQLK